MATKKRVEGGPEEKKKEKGWGGGGKYVGLLEMQRKLVRRWSKLRDRKRRRQTLKKTGHLEKGKGGTKW